MRIRVWIHKVADYGSKLDPDPQHQFWSIRNFLSGILALSFFYPFNLLHPALCLIKLYSHSLLGVGVGRLRVHHQPHPSPRLLSHHHGPLQRGKSPVVLTRVLSDPILCCCICVYLAARTLSVFGSFKSVLRIQIQRIRIMLPDP